MRMPYLASKIDETRQSLRVIGSLVTAFALASNPTKNKRQADTKAGFKTQIKEKRIVDVCMLSCLLKEISCTEIALHKFEQIRFSFSNN